MENNARTFMEVLAAIGGAIASFFCGLPPIMWVLIAVMTIDYITGILCGLTGKSKKTETGYLASVAAFRGLLKKALIILVVLLAALLDKAVSMGTGATFEAVAGATCLWFIASEGFSILENVASMGVPIPKILQQALEIFRSKGDGPAKADAPKKEEQQEDKNDEPDGDQDAGGDQESAGGDPEE